MGELATSFGIERKKPFILIITATQPTNLLKSKTKVIAFIYIKSEFATTEVSIIFHCNLK